MSEAGTRKQSLRPEEQAAEKRLESDAGGLTHRGHNSTAGSYVETKVMAVPT